jgi:3'-phosphoadenosine 5'-phosphosulfate sulfotransferase (PAPS reductase)/FAD synthetase
MVHEVKTMDTTQKMNNVVSLSGGKDSTAMLLMMLERGEPIHSVVFFDTGWEFPQMYEHIELLEKRIGIRIWRLQSKFPFDYWMMARPVIARKEPNKGEVTRIGQGWPSINRRWCTKQKTNTIHEFARVIPGAVQCIGYAADETGRSVSSKITARFPLQEYGITEAKALLYCYAKGYDWGGLYEHFGRVSCFCCPLQRIGELRTLRRHFPDLWQRMLSMEDAMPPGTNRGFRGYKTVHDLDERFKREDSIARLF